VTVTTAGIAITKAGDVWAVAAGRRRNVCPVFHLVQ